ncbi:TPA: efflux RND transporter periplasmic adaptor subunit [Candidatus Scatousia excrementigallinarum]|uniref:Efflux RND transporter periplasmic adaptor subunit n=1 Tax=Candidatus Scatousia excrementigallinarum TaxID=2840935 RepID=A0A9D1EZ56_9BACT|nr:efflux RND transporter periplasmic adaptor subunit [Candidatus Scatousia excrementigallinarum]
MKTKKAKIITCAVIIALIGSGFAYKSFKSRVKYHTRPLERCTITQVVEASGTINPVNTVSVGSTVSGLIQDIYVDFNSQVKKGQILARIDPRNFEATVQQNQAQIANAQANVAKLQAIADYDKKMYERYKNLYAKNFVAKSELDQYQSTYYSDLAQIRAAQAQVNQYKANLKTAQTNLGYTQIIAPVDGTIISREIDVGQPVAASFQAPELFTIAQDLTKMQIEVNVSEADIGKVQDGQDVTYTLDGYPDSVFKGKVTQVRISPTTVSNVVTYTVIVDVKNDDLKLIPGMTANVSIITDKSENVMCAPSIALKFNPNTDGTRYKTQGIWILEKRRPKRINIETGASDDTNTEIISKELNEGDRIIVDSSLSKNKDKKNQRRRGPGPF